VEREFGVLSKRKPQRPNLLRRVRAEKEFGGESRGKSATRERAFYSGVCRFGVGEGNCDCWNRASEIGKRQGGRPVKSVREGGAAFSHGEAGLGGRGGRGNTQQGVETHLVQRKSQNVQPIREEGDVATLSIQEPSRKAEDWKGLETGGAKKTVKDAKLELKGSLLITNIEDAHVDTNTKAWEKRRSISEKSLYLRLPRRGGTLQGFHTLMKSPGGERGQPHTMNENLNKLRDNRRKVRNERGGGGKLSPD